MARFTNPVGQGGGNADTGYITFDGVKIIGAGEASGDGYNNGTIELVPDNDLYENDQYLIIDPTFPSHIHIRAGGTQDDSNAELFLGAEKTHVRINDGLGIARLQASYIYDESFSSSDWASAVIGEDENNVRTIVVTTPSQSIQDLIISEAWDTASALYVGYDGGEKQQFYSLNLESGVLTLTLDSTGTPSSPTAITSLQLYYELSSRVDVDMNDDKELDIVGNGIPVNIRSTSGISIDAGDDVMIEANNDIQIDALNDIILSSDGGGQYLHTSESPTNQIASLGDIGVETSYAVQGGTDGTQPTFGGDPLFSASYVRMSSNLVHFQIQVDMDNITSFGTGQYYMTLPFDSKYGYKFRDGCLHDISTGRTYHVSGHVYAGSNVLTLYTSDTQGNTLYDFAFTSAEPITLSTADNFHIAGTYIAENLS